MSFKQATVILASFGALALFLLHGNNPEKTNPETLIEDATQTLRESVTSIQKGISPEFEANKLQGVAVAISDGDTFTLKNKNNQTFKIRLAGIDAPEKKQDYGTRAKTELSNLIWGKDLEVTVVETDRYQRNIAWVRTPEQKAGETVNLKMLEAGMAWHYTQYDKSTRLGDAQNKAKAQKKGLWEKEAVEPWLFRKTGKAGKP